MIPQNHNSDSGSDSVGRSHDSRVDSTLIGYYIWQRGKCTHSPSLCDMYTSQILRWSRLNPSSTSYLMLIQLPLKHICYGNAISNSMSDSERDFHACFLCPTLLHQPPFFGFSEMLTTKKSATGVGS